MNNPPYILVDVFGIRNETTGLLTSGILYEVKQALGLPVLNYQYGYVDELKNTLANYDKSPTFAGLKFPLVYLVQPFSITGGDIECYGKVNLELFIINKTVQDKKAVKRMTDNFKPVINPIKYELIEQISRSLAFMEQDDSAIKYKETDMYYWGDEQQTKMINEVFDCKFLNGLNLIIRHKCP